MCFVECDIKWVYDDVFVLLDWGIIECVEDGKVWIFFEVIYVNFDLRVVV